MKYKYSALPMKWLTCVGFIAGVFFFCHSGSPQVSGWEQVPEILNEIIPPVFPDRDFNVTDFGAIGDGDSDCTTAFQSAVQACSDAGGGRVVVPPGMYLTGAIHLKSNVCLHIEKDAAILFSQDPEKYLPVVFTRFEGVELMNYSPFIYAFEQENLAITGEGTLNGQGDASHWWSWTGSFMHGWKPGMPNQHHDRDSLFQMAEKGIPPEKRVFGEGHFLRVNFIQFYRCKNILIEDVTIHRSPMWEIHPVLSENITVRNVHVDSHGPNNDGCNPESCKNVLIEACYFDTGDDCIAIKSGRNADGRRVNVDSENIIVRKCRMKDGHGGVVIGSEISGSCRNVYAEDCIMDSPNLENALRIKTNSSRGGVVENIFMRDVEIGEVKYAIVRVNFNYENGDIGKFTPIVRNIFMQNVKSRKSRHALFLDGYERSPISNIIIENCRFDGVQDGEILNFVDNLNMKNVYINGKLQ
jgi:polygalacturonase